jgi:integrase
MAWYTPLLRHLAKWSYTVCQGPKRSGRSRQGAPVHRLEHSRNEETGLGGKSRFYIYDPSNSRFLEYRITDIPLARAFDWNWRVYPVLSSGGTWELTYVDTGDGRRLFLNDPATVSAASARTLDHVVADLWKNLKQPGEPPLFSKLSQPMQQRLLSFFPMGTITVSEVVGQRPTSTPTIEAMNARSGTDYLPYYIATFGTTVRESSPGELISVLKHRSPSRFSQYEAIFNRPCKEVFQDQYCRFLPATMKEFRYWSDVNAAKVEKYLTDRRNEKPKDRPNRFGHQTSNFYTENAQQFCRWMVDEGRATQSPLRRLPKLNVKKDRRHERGAFTSEQIRRLLDSTATQPERFGMAGPERVLVYRLAVEAGLRAGDLLRLTRRSFRLEGPEPTVIIAAKDEKNGKGAELPLRPETAAALSVHLNSKLPSAKAFNMPPNYDTADMIYADLKAAGLPNVDAEDRHLDFHALRHTCGSWLADAGVHPKVIQRLMRHSTIVLTMDRYCKPHSASEAAAVAKLPDLGVPVSAVGLATGTDGQSLGPSARPGATRFLPLSLPLIGGRQRISKDLGGQVTGRIVDAESFGKTEAKHISAGFSEEGSKEPRVGLEPTTCGLQNRCSTN